MATITKHLLNRKEKEMNLKSIMVAGSSALILLSGSSAMAQWNTQPFGNGFIHNGPGGRSFTSQPFGSGWIHSGPGMRTTTTMPFGNGWITRGGWMTQPFGNGYIHSSGGRSFTSQPFGNGWIHSGPGMRTTTTMPFGNGWITRGQSAAVLFDDKDFYEKVDVTLFADALQIRDAAVLMGFAWDLKGAETILGKVDKKTTSTQIFELAAKIAIEQGNEAVLKNIIALAPECKKFEAQFAMKGKTRGQNKSVCALPQLCVLPANNYKKAIESLTMWQQPALGQYICSAYRGITQQSADTASMLVNEGRITMNPQMIAMGALELSKYPYNSELGIKFEPAQIFAEAVELAIVKQDKTALTQLAALYNTASFKSEECAKYIQSELAMLSNTRGLKPKAKCAPGDFGPADFHKLIRTVYFEDACEQVK